jgi:hypothetical protein
MKNTRKILATFIVLVCAISTTSAQINRTLDTKVVDILAQFPTQNATHTNQLIDEILELNTEGILKFCDMLVSPGTGNDTQVRFALNSLATYSGGKEHNITENIVEKAFLSALQKQTDIEIQSFLIERLALCGSDYSATALSPYLSNTKLYNVALATITSIGTDKAAKVIFKALKTSDDVTIKPSLIHALGNLRFVPAATYIQELTAADSIITQQFALMALSEIAPVTAMEKLTEAANNANYTLDDSNAILALINYGNRLKEKGEVELSKAVGKLLLKNCTAENQLHFRAAGIHLLRENNEANFIKTLLKEAKHTNAAYRGAVFIAAAQNITDVEVAKWAKAYKKMSTDAKPQLLRLLQNSNETIVFEKCIVPAIHDTNEQVSIAGIKSLAFQSKEKALPLLLKLVANSKNKVKTTSIKETLLRVSSLEDGAILASNLEKSTIEGKKVLVEVLAAKRASANFTEVLDLLNLKDETLNTVIFEALPQLAATEHLSEIVTLLTSENNPTNIKNIQKAIVTTIDASEKDHSELIFNTYNTIQNNEVLLPVLPVLNNDKALELVAVSLNSNNKKQQLEALKALANWRTNSALPHLFTAVTSLNDSELKSTAFNNYLVQVRNSSYPDDQKLLLFKKLMPLANTVDAQKSVLNNIGNVKTFLALVFVSEYLNNPALKATASNAAIKIALPTPGKKDGLTGDLVREIVTNSIDNLTGPDSQYIKIDVTEFLNNMPQEKGFVAIFNGKDFTGWEGLVENPIARNKMSKKALAKAQAKANTQMMKDWYVKDGIIGFKGEGYNNICTIKDYGDFEMLVDWKITNGGDSGIYLRGTPQVQIWDIALTQVGAQVGSGGLYNNQKNERIPLEVADNPVDEWNTFRIKMVGERVTVFLNGVLVTDNVILENYWDRALPIFTKEAIELQAHGEDLGFKNIYVREINSGTDLLSEEERTAGFKSLFNGKDLDHWIGNKTDYIVENNEIAVRPKQGGHGNLYTAEEYSDFNFRFEFKLTDGANNGLGIHTPLEGDAAYVGKELQILDNTASIYANLEPYQYHGSVYGVIAAKRGHLKPIGQWNQQEVIIKGDAIKIILNGEIIVDGDMKEASKNGTLDGLDHPGLKRNKGHIAFLGHGSELEFRNIRIKDLSK